MNRSMEQVRFPGFDLTEMGTVNIQRIGQPLLGIAMLCSDAGDSAAAVVEKIRHLFHQYTELLRE